MALRSCIGCRTVCEKSDLLRLILSERKLEVDELDRRPGRGVYVHRKLSCIRKCMDSKLLAHRFRFKGQLIDASALGEVLVTLSKQI